MSPTTGNQLMTQHKVEAWRQTVPYKFVVRFHRIKRLYRGLLARLQRVLRTRSDRGAEAVWTHGSKVTYHGELKAAAVASETCCCETVGLSAALRPVVVGFVRCKAGEDDVVVIGGRSGIG